MLAYLCKKKWKHREICTLLRLKVVWGLEWLRKLANSTIDDRIFRSFVLLFLFWTFPVLTSYVSIFRCLIGKRNTWVSICYTVLLCSTLLILYSSNLLHKKPFEPSESYKVDSQVWKVLHKVLNKLKNNMSPLKIKADSCRFLKTIS